MNSHLYIPFTVTTLSAAVVAAGLHLGSPAANEAVAAAAKPAAAAVADGKKQALNPGLYV
jgi:hypothetical protein